MNKPNLLASIEHIEKCATSVIEHFQKTVANTIWEAADAIEWQGRDVMKSRQTLVLAHQFKGYLNRDEYTADQAFQEFQDYLSHRLLSETPWTACSTNPIANVKRESEANAMSQFLADLRQIKHSIELEERMEKTVELRQNYRLLIEVEAMSEKSYAAFLALPVPRSKAAQQEVRQQRRQLAYWLIKQAIDANSRYLTIEEALTHKNVATA